MKITKEQRNTALIMLGENFTQKWVEKQKDRETLRGFIRSAEDSRMNVLSSRQFYFSGIFFLLNSIFLMGYGIAQSFPLGITSGMMLSLPGFFFVWARTQTSKPIDHDLSKDWKESRKKLIQSGVVERLAYELHKQELNQYCSDNQKENLLKSVFNKQCSSLAETVIEAEKNRENIKRQAERNNLRFLYCFGKEGGIKLPPLENYFPKTSPIGDAFS